MFLPKDAVNWAITNRSKVLCPHLRSRVKGSFSLSGQSWREVEYFISREVLSSFESFSSVPASAGWRIGVGAAQSFSKIKLPNSGNQAKLSVKNRVRSLLKLTAIIQVVKARPRTLAHLAMAFGLTGIVISSSLGGAATGTSLQPRTEELGSTLDHISTATVAAAVADKADFVAAPDAAKQAETLNSQVTLPTAGDTALAKRAVVETAGSDKRTVHSYTVAPGDTISGIAARFGVTTSTIKWANNLSDVDEVAPGDRLTILPISGILHTVQPGETAKSLAAKYDSNAAQIISFNNAEVKGLQAGQKIIIPDGVKQEAARPRVTPQLVVASIGTPTLTNFRGGGNGYSYGYCTWYVATRRSIPAFWGNAANWYYAAQGSGFGVGSRPVPGAIAWTGMGYAGHVGIVESVNGNNIVISDMNYNGGWGRVTTRVDSAYNYRYIY